MTGDDDVLAGVLIQLAAHAEQISSLDSRENDHHQDTTSQLGMLHEHSDKANARIGAMTTILGRHAAVVDTLGGLDQQVAGLARDIAHLSATVGADSLAYRPQPTPRWWQLAATEREAAIDRLRAWVEQIYQPSYGQLAASLPACWDRHPVCLFTLDWLSELWSVLYLSPERTASTLAAQAEWQTRLLPAAATQMTGEAAHCQHGNGSFRYPASRRPLLPHDRRDQRKENGD